MKNEFNCLFLGGLFPKETENEIINNSIGSIQNAANILQWNIVKGLDENLKEPVKILNSLYIGSFPKRYKKMFIPSYPFNHTENANDFNVGFCNLSGYKIFSRQYTLKRKVKQWINNTSEKKVIIAYAMTDVMLSALAYAKKQDKNIITCLVVPDLPQFMNTKANVSFLYKTLKSIDIKLQESKFKYIDSFVFLTEQMNEKIGAKNYTVVEGIANDFYINSEPTNDTNKTVVYTGGLNLKYGISNLVDAFMKIDDPDYRLILCGSGDAVPYIKQCQSIDSRIDYRGLLPHNEILLLQMSATVLVNPRQNNEEFTKYSFPSKTMEYMLSGKPVVMYKLDGIPNDYDEFLNYVENDSVIALRDKIFEVCNLTKSERDKMGIKARNYVLNEKSSIKQVQKIIDSISVFLNE